VDFRVAAEAFLAVEAAFREEATISLEVREVFPVVPAVSLATAVLLIAAVFLAAAVASREAEIVFPVVEAGAFPAMVAVLFNAEAAAVLLDRTVWRTILHCFPTLAGRDQVAVDCHRVQPEIKRLVVAHRREEARHSCRPAIGRVATWEVGIRNLPFAIKIEAGRV
jgi:hypothetical protein